MKRAQSTAIIAAIVALASCSAQKHQVPLRFGIMPDADSLPIMVAQAEGFFGKEGVAVELVPFTNAQERDAAIQAGRVDGAISDILAAAFLVAGGFDMRITSASDGRYGIVSAPGSGIENAGQLAGKRIGMSTNTIIQYVVDAITAAAGRPQASYQTVAVPKMPVRLEMLLAGQIDAAGLPEPMLTAAVARGAHLVGTTDQFQIDAAVLLFSKSVLDARLDDIRRFYKAYVDATDKIESDPNAWRSFLVEKASFPAEIKDAYRFVHYRNPTLPSNDQISRVLAWLKVRGLLSRDLDAADLIDGRAIAAW
ncbi:MAG TPA: ABC transporter substrate-binding protein [bacterium]|nr:ABC transporter substrate-binding protein [bacterium]